VVIILTVASIVSGSIQQKKEKESNAASVSVDRIKLKDDSAQAQQMSNTETEVEIEFEDCAVPVGTQDDSTGCSRKYGPGTHLEQFGFVCGRD